MDGAKLITEWIGALLFWIIMGFQVSISEQLNSKNRTRNIIVGYVLELIIFAAQKIKD